MINRDGSGYLAFEQTDPALGSEGEAALDWSPDGKNIAFIGDDHHAIRLVDATTREIQTLLAGAVAERYSHHNGLCWGRADGDILLNSQFPADARTQALFRLAPNTGEVSQLTFEGDSPRYMVSPASSPDGQRIAVVRHQSADALPRNIFLMDSNGGALRQLTTDDTLRHLNPSWLPDGKRILYTAGEDGERQLYMIDIESGVRTRLTHGEWDDVEPDICGRR